MKKAVDYSEVIEKIDIISKWLMLKLTEKISSQKEIYLRNSLAKNVCLLKSILLLSQSNAYNDGWILYRSLVERLVYIYYLTEKDYFELFDEWSFIKKYEYRNNARADEKFKHILLDPNFQVKSEESNKYNKLKAKNIKWKKPDPSLILKKVGLDFIYKFAYDFASMHTHPMISDGEFEFLSITGLEPNPYKTIDQSILINNSILITTLIHQVVLNRLDFKFRAIVYSFFEEVRKYINNESNTYDEVFFKLLKMSELGMDWFEK